MYMWKKIEEKPYKPYKEYDDIVYGEEETPKVVEEELTETQQSINSEDTSLSSLEQIQRKVSEFEKTLRKR